MPARSRFAEASPPKLSRGRKISPILRERFDKLAGIFEVEPEIGRQELATRLGLSGAALEFTLIQMRKHDAARYNRRALRDSVPVTLIFRDGRTETRRLRTDEAHAQNEMVLAAARDGTLESITRSFPHLTREKMLDLLRRMRRRGIAPGETRFASASKRPAHVVQAQMRLIARRALQGQSLKLPDLRKSLDKQAHRVGTATRRFPVEAKWGVHDLVRTLELKVRNARATARQRTGPDGRPTWDLSGVERLATYLGIEYGQVAELAEKLAGRPKRKLSPRRKPGP